MTASIPLMMITNAQRIQLETIGYTEKQINAMKPSEAHEILGIHSPQPVTAHATAEQVSAIRHDSNGKPDISALLDASKPKTLLDRWQMRSLTDAYADRPPTQYVVDGLLAMPSLTIGYGSPAGMKSMLFGDMAICVAKGEPWLTGLPTEAGQTVKAFRTVESGVLWIDYDNGIRRTDERFEALAKARNLPENAPVHYVSMAQPWLDATDGYLVRELAESIIAMDIKLVVIDNLGLISGDADENTADMVKVMGNLRRLAEDTGAAVLIIHHQRKGNMADRAGELLRGHSSIEASLDLALLVTRDGQEPRVTITPTKVRGASVEKPFGAEFTYEHKPGTHDLATAKFWGTPILSAKEIEKQEIAAVIEIVLNRMVNSGEVATQSELVKQVQAYAEVNCDIKKPGRNKVLGVLAEMEMSQQIRYDIGTNNSKVYKL